jgi:GTP-binding protein HflX
VFLSDTVGFIRDLPHHLVSSFQATLEEARQADLLLHVIDAADPDAVEHVGVVEETLSEIGAGGVPRIAVLNQIDRVQDPLQLRFLEDRLPRCVRTSAVTGEGLVALRDAVHAYVTRHHRQIVVEVEAGDGRLLASLRTWAEVEEIRYEEGRARLRMRASDASIERIRQAGGRILEGAPTPGDGGEEEEG